MGWEDSIKYVYLICNAEKEPVQYHRVLPHFLMRGIPKSHLKLACPVWNDTLTDQIIFNVYNPFLERGNLPNFTHKGASLSKSEISLNINFYNIIKHAENDISGNESILIFKSNTYLRRDFGERLSKIMVDLSGTEWDYVDIGKMNSKTYYAPTEIHKSYEHLAKCTCDSMLLNSNFIKKITKTFLPFKDSLEWELNFQILLHKAKAFYADPPLAESGSIVSRNITYV
jgi:hypothetical protein